MYDHIGLRVADLDAATRFYTAVLAPLGHVLCSSGDGYAGFGPKGEPALWLHLSKGRKADGVHVAFRAKDHDAVKAFHSAGPEERRPRQWRRGSAQGLQPDLLCGIPDRSRRQQCRGGVQLSFSACLRHCEELATKLRSNFALMRRSNDGAPAPNAIKDIFHGLHP